MTRKLRSFAVKIAQLGSVLLGVSFLVYLLLGLLPGDTASVLVAGSDDPSPEAEARVRSQLGLDEPFFERYATWLGHALQGDLGISYRSKEAVAEAIGGRLPVTVELLVLALALSVAVAVPLAVYAAHHRDRLLDRVVTVLTFGMQSVPNFMVCLVMIFLFAVTLGVLPAVGFTPLSDGVWENAQSVTIPTIALSFTLVPVYIRVLRNEMIRVLQEDHVLVARAEGLRSRTILFRYALRPALPTLVTVIGINIGTLIGGTLVIELITGLPGMGSLLFTAINNRDYILVQGVVLFIAAAYVVANFAVDFVQTVIDPRTRA
ncbi:ABC transporter permease [Streptomyces sp. NPDC058221]|uniref:ABC transporter permease n=1 Tax=Streptomyces sp. NPDC058221 TaxID=3346388 RepID=UPI0036E3FF76